MNRSQTLYNLQLLDTEIANAKKRINEIDAILQDNQALHNAESHYQKRKEVSVEKHRLLKVAESHVADQAQKIDQNQKKLYGGAVTNPKELEDLQLEFTSLIKYREVLEDRQLEAMIAAEQAQNELDISADKLESIKEQTASDHQTLTEEKKQLEKEISITNNKREDFLKKEDIPDLDIYNTLKASSGGIAVTLMVSSSCSSCGANIPSAIEQEARAPAKLAYCPTCKRILHSA